MKTIALATTTICVLIAGCSSSKTESHIPDKCIVMEELPVNAIPVSDCSGAQLYMLILEFKHTNNRFPSSHQELKEFHSTRKTSVTMKPFTSITFHTEKDKSQTIEWVSPDQPMPSGTLTIDSSGENAKWTNYYKSDYMPNQSNEPIATTPVD